MAKYRILAKEELEGLEKDFVSFLVVNGIASEDWLKIKVSQPEKAEMIVELFSDVVFEKILRNVEYLEFYSTKYVRAFRCGREEIEMITMESENEASNFKDPSFIARSMTNPPEDLLIYQAEKPYSKVREMEIFEMIQEGCLISSAKLFSSLKEALDQ